MVVRLSSSAAQLSKWTGKLTGGFLWRPVQPRPIKGVCPPRTNVISLRSLLVSYRSEVTVAVLGRKEVGKTTFIAHSLVSINYTRVVIEQLHVSCILPSSL